MFKKIVKFSKDTKCPIGHLVSGLSKFIKYNTLVAAIVVVAFVAVASVMASSEDVKKIIGEEVVEKSGVDNTVLLAADLENFDLKMEITNVLEDDENYYIDYQYNTLAIKDNVWREVLKREQIIVSKAALDGEDLGLYLMEELGEIIDYQLAFLKEVQEKEEEKGVTVVLEKTEYTGLIGLVFDTKTKELPGYEPVVKPPVAEVADTLQDDSTQSMELTDDSSTPQPFGTMEPTDDDYVEDSYYYEWLIGNCISNGGYWYDSVCNAEEEVIETDDSSAPQPSGTMEPTICDADNLDLCIDQVLCEDAGLYWYDSNDDGNEVCNILQDDSSAPQPSGTMEPTDEPAEKTDEEICLEMELYWYEGECHVEEEVVEEKVKGDQGNEEDLILN
jgi:hypothetical protein